MTESAAITICTVSFNSRHWLNLGRSLADRLNPGARLRWVVVENSPAGSDLALGGADEGFEVIAGAPFQPRPYAPESCHHAAGMNKTPAHVSTRFAVFCDPDFFIVKRNWVTDVVDHMKANELAIMGVPWHPRWVYKTRYFPCVHCMFVDLNKIPASALDFTPGFEGLPGYAKDPNRSRENNAKILKRFLWVVDPLNFRKRRHIGTSRDTSWRIYDRFFADSAIRTECFQPVFSPDRTKLESLVDFVVPDRFSFVPKRRDYFTERGFGDRGYPDLVARGWEEFVWSDRPFGFHVRSQPKVKDKQSLEEHYREVETVLDAFLVSSPQPADGRQDVNRLAPVHHEEDA